MAGETARTEAICTEIRPWSRTSHIVTWLTPTGRVVTVVKGAVRPKSLFLGQYDLNYTCDIVYYLRARGELHALRDCAPLDSRDVLRGDYRALVLAGYCRRLATELAPVGPDCRLWYELLGDTLSRGGSSVAELLAFELAVLRLAGLAPDFSGYDRDAEWSAFSLETGAFGEGKGRCIRVSRAVAEYLCTLANAPAGGRLPHFIPVEPDEKKLSTPLDAARVIGVFYQFHVDCAFEVRRAVLELIS